MASAPAISARTHRPGGGLAWSGYLLGFALGGFFDGILLHQVLQWHHLLSALEGAAFQDLQMQILADGLFHAAMYVIAGVGLWVLWRSRHDFAGRGADRALLARALIGFGAWHVVDGVLSHWILGIHRIRMDVDNKLFWDLLWFFLFGVAFIVAGWLLSRRSSGGAMGGHRPVLPLALVLLVGVAAPVAALPPPGVKTVTALFRQGTTFPDVIAAAGAVDGRIVGSDPSGRLWAIQLGGNQDGRVLYRHGAVLISHSLLPLGCFDWMRP